MEGYLFYGQRALFVFIEMSLVLFAAASIGFAFGRIISRRVEDRAQVGAVQASILGLLALMLGFTFAAASARYDARRLLGVDEANALGTTFLRAQTLPEPYRTTMSRMLHEYIDLRVESISSFRDTKKLMHIKNKTERLQQDMWGQASSAARRYPNAITGLFIGSLNESIDLYSARIAAFRNRVPESVLWILACISIAALAITGYSFGLAGQRAWIVIALVSVLVAAVIIMIVDLDRPQVGPTQVNQQSMIDLRNSLSEFEESSRKVSETQGM
jgi:hypothetical protein